MAECLMPWYGLSLSPNGNIKPCCLSREVGENIYSSGFDSVKKSYSSSKGFRQLRHQFLKGKRPLECHSCWEREKFVGHSRRIWFKEKFDSSISSPGELSEVVDSPQWIQMDINLSNQCNLKCRMCGVWASHRWIEEEKALGNIEGNPFKRETRKSYLGLLEADMKVLESLIPYMKNVKRIDFKGGEPFLARNHQLFLEKLIQAGLNKVVLHYTTNGTFVNEKILKILSQFKKVRISFSIEATGALYSYIRGGDYSIRDLYKNLKKFDELNNVCLFANVSMQAYNLLNLKDLYEELNSLRLKRFSPEKAFQCIVNKPDYLSPFVWPQRVRDIAIKELEGIEDFKSLTGTLVSKKFSEDIFLKFLDFTKRLDSLRNENFWSMVPEIKSVII